MGDLIDDGERKTRKPHKCHGCNETIPTGTITDYCKVADEGTVTTFYTCKRCKDWCNDKKCHDCFEMECTFEGFVKECMINGR